MLVVKIYLWPLGDRTKARLISQATIDLQGVAREDRGKIKRGERCYRVRLLKGLAFGGPADGDDVRPQSVPKSKVWREVLIRGHRPGKRGGAARGEWDLLGGALKAILGRRLEPYRDGEEPS